MIREGFSEMTFKQKEEKASYVTVWSKRILGGGTSDCNPESGTCLECFRHSEASRRGRSESSLGDGSCAVL